MDDLISRQAAIKKILLCENHDMEHDFEFNEGLTVAMNAVKELPTADLSEYCDKLWKTAYERGKAEAQPRRGRWVCEIRHYKDTAGEFDYQYIYCSECGEQRRIGWRDANYCPNCGARMEES